MPTTTRPSTSTAGTAGVPEKTMARCRAVGSVLTSTSVNGTFRLRSHRRTSSQREHSGQQRQVLVPLDEQGLEIEQGFLGPNRPDLASQRQPAQDLRHLHIDEVRRGELLIRRKQQRGHAPGSLSLQQQVQERRGIDDNHRSSRS